MLAIQMIREKYIQKAEQKRHRNASNVVQGLQEDMESPAVSAAVPLARRQDAQIN
jgi:hypothetical protein